MIQSYENVLHSQLNKSTSKQMYSFPKAVRFRKIPRSQSCGKFYTLPDVCSHRATSMGYGHKFDFTLTAKDKCKSFYQIPSTFNISKSSIKTTFGAGRDRLVYIDKSIPGPAKYNILKPFASDTHKYTIGKSRLYNSASRVSNSPGPGQYKEWTQAGGIYFSSKYHNSTQVSFGSAKRFGNKREITPGPADYTFKGLMGENFISKFTSSMPISMTKKSKLNTSTSDITPGPGKYECFSEFGSYIKKKYKY